MIFESGGSEGSYAHYLAHHLTPELGEFKSSKFGNYSTGPPLQAHMPPQASPYGSPGFLGDA